MAQQRWPSSESKAPCKHSRHLDPFWHCMGADVHSTMPGSRGISRKAAPSARLHMEIPSQPWEAGKLHSPSTLCCPGLWARLLDASWAISAWCWMPWTRNRLLGLLNSSPSGKRNGRNAIGSRWSTSNQRRGSYMTTQSVLAPNHSDNTVLRKMKKLKIC